MSPPQTPLLTADPPLAPTRPRRPIPAPSAGTLSPATVQAPASGTVTASFDAVGANCTATPCTTGYNVTCPDGQSYAFSPDGGAFVVSVGPASANINSAALVSAMVCTVTYNVTDDLDRIALANTTLTIL
jgi:hypothetical protein